MAKSVNVTSAGINPAEDRAHRMRMYFIAMALRVVCVVSLFWVRGWWILLVAAGAVFLPWFAVMVGNAVAHGGEEEHDTPEPLQLQSAEPEIVETATDDAADIIVIDVDPTRRSSQPRSPQQPGGSPGSAAAGHEPFADAAGDPA